MIDAQVPHEATVTREKGVHLPLLPVRDIIVFPQTVVPLYLGRHSSIRAVEDAVQNGNKLFLATQRDAKVNEPTPQDIYTVGVIATIAQRLYLPDGTAKLLVKAERRGRIVRYLTHPDFLLVEAEPINEQVDQTQSDIDLLVQDAHARFAAHAHKSGTIAPETDFTIAKLTEPSLLADTIISHLPISLENKQLLLETTDPIQRLQTVLTYLPPKFEASQLSASVRVELEAPIHSLEARKLANDYLLAWFARDINSILAMVTDDCVFDDSPMTMTQPTHGSQALASYLTTLFTAFPDFTVMAKQISVDARRVWIEWVIEGTHEEIFLGIAPTQRRVVIRGSSSLLLRNGKIAEERRYWDASNLLQQLGQSTLPSGQ